jgi:hypothetical protein
MALPQEYLDLINYLTQKKQQDVSSAESQGIGEAIRRGLVNPTGTSDIEMSLRSAKVAPVEQAYQGQIANIGMGAADRQFQSDLQKYIQQQEFAESARGREFAGSEAARAREFQDTQSDLDRALQREGFALERELAAMNKPKKKKWYQTGAEILSGGLGTAVGTGLGGGWFKK